MLPNIAGASANEEVSTSRIASLVKVCSSIDVYGLLLPV
jgi:hypothetical protein